MSEEEEFVDSKGRKATYFAKGWWQCSVCGKYFLRDEFENHVCEKKTKKKRVC